MSSRTNPNERTPGARTPPGPGLAFHIRAWMLVGGGIPLVALFFFGYLAAREALIEASEEHLISVADARRSQIATWLNERRTDLEVISRSKDCIEMVQLASAHHDHASVCRYLESFQTGSRDYQTLALYDLNWHWVASNTSSPDAPHHCDEHALRAALGATSGPVLAPIEAASGRVEGLSLAHRLGPAEAPIGFVVAELDLAGSLDPILTDRAGLGRTGRVYLADLADRGRVIVPASKESYTDARILERVPSAGMGAVHVQDRTGRKVYAGFTAIETEGWLVVAEMDEKEALDLLFSLRRGFVIAGLLTVLGVVVFSSRIAHRLSSPLSQLASAARRIKEGRRHERVPSLEGREVEEVGRAFNEMLDALEETQRKQVQAQTLAAVGELSSGIVHEMRNRLSSVKMNLQALGRKVGEDERYAELGQIALEQVSRVEGLLNDLLQYARPIDLDLRPVQAREILRAAADLHQEEAKARQMRLEVDDRTDGITLIADRQRLEEALSNLVRNAVEAGPVGGSVVLRARLPGGEDGAWILEVEDDGPGLAGIANEDLFRPFFTTKEKGTGLGLAHARKIAELHGGHAAAESRPEGGAVFRLEIPRKGVGA